MFNKRPATATIEPADQAGAADELNPQALWQPAAAKQRKTVEQLLLERGQITEEQAAQAKSVQHQTPGKSIAQILLTMNSATEAQVLAAHAETLGIPFETPDKATVDPTAFELLPTEYIRKQSALPLRFEEQVLVVAMSDLTNVFLLDEV